MRHGKVALPSSALDAHFQALLYFEKRLFVLQEGVVLTSRATFVLP